MSEQVNNKYLVIGISEPRQNGLFRENANHVPDAVVLHKKRNGGHPAWLLLKYVCWSLFLLIFWVPIVAAALHGTPEMLMGLLVVIPHTCLLAVAFVRDVVPNRHLLTVVDGTLSATSKTWKQPPGWMPRRSVQETQLAIAELARFEATESKLFGVGTDHKRLELLTQLPEATAHQIATALNDAYDLT